MGRCGEDDLALGRDRHGHGRGVAVVSWITEATGGSGAAGAASAVARAALIRAAMTSGGFARRAKRPARPPAPSGTIAGPSSQETRLALPVSACRPRGNVQAWAWRSGAPAPAGSRSTVTPAGGGPAG